MNVGHFRDRGTLMRRSTVNDGGAQVSTFTPVLPVRVPCQVESPTAARVERIFGGQVTPTATHLVTLRAWTTVRLSDQFIWHDAQAATNRTLDIVGRQPIGGPMRPYLVLACEERHTA